MPVALLEGRPVADKIKEQIRDELASLKTTRGIAPRLVALQIGDNESSAIYARNQARAAQAAGIEYELKALKASASQNEALKVIDALNRDASVTAIILQLPVPPRIDPRMLVMAVDPDKDAEGMHPENLGKILDGKAVIGPCTAMAVMELLDAGGVSLYGREVCVVGHSEIVGKPLALMLLNKFATTTVCHIATFERGLLAHHVARAEVLIVAVGRPGLIEGEWIKEDAVVIDVGINRVGDKILGDVQFDVASRRASLITPVPGGVGPLTTVMLMRNVVQLFKRGIL